MYYYKKMIEVVRSQGIEGTKDVKSKEHMDHFWYLISQAECFVFQASQNEQKEIPAHNFDLDLPFSVCHFELSDKLITTTDPADGEKGDFDWGIASIGVML